MRESILARHLLVTACSSVTVLCAQFPERSLDGGSCCGLLAFAAARNLRAVDGCLWPQQYRKNIGWRAFLLCHRRSEIHTSFDREQCSPLQPELWQEGLSLPALLVGAPASSTNLEHFKAVMHTSCCKITSTEAVALFSAAGLAASVPLMLGRYILSQPHASSVGCALCSSRHSGTVVTA